MSNGELAFGKDSAMVDTRAPVDAVPQFVSLLHCLNGARHVAQFVPHLTCVVIESGRVVRTKDFRSGLCLIHCNFGFPKMHKSLIAFAGLSGSVRLLPSKESAHARTSIRRGRSGSIG